MRSKWHWHRRVHCGTSAPRFFEPYWFAAQLEVAASQGRALLTHNRVDFEREFLVRFKKHRSHPGILVATRQTSQEMVHRLLIILDSTTAGEMQD